MTGLRTIWGVSIQKVESDFGIRFKDHLLFEAQSFLSQGHLSLEDGILKATAKGKFLTDGIASDLFFI